MRKLFTLIILGSTSLLFAGQNKDPYESKVTCQQPQYSKRQQPPPCHSKDKQKNNSNRHSSPSSNQRSVSDREILRKIQDALRPGWFTQGFQNVSFDVEDGEVTLRGSVDSLESKNKVEDIVRNIEGVNYIYNQMTTDKEDSDSYSITIDTDRIKGDWNLIKGKIKEKWGRLTNDEITEINGKKEQLLGKIQKKYGFTKEKAEREFTEWEINRKIQEILNPSWFPKGFQDVTFEVKEGNVTLRGTVNSFDDKNKVEESVRNIEGVKQVNNQIKVTKENKPKDRLKGDWNLIKGKIKEKWGRLTNDEITEINGKREQLLGKIQKKYGFTKERAEQELDEWEKQTNAEKH